MAIRAWLEENLRTGTDKHYWHRLLVERSSGRTAAIGVLKALVDNAHEDARRYLRGAFGDSLDPIAEPTPMDPAKTYPAALSLPTLYGYFGEVLAGIVAEHFGSFATGPWQVPAYLFRFHVVAFQELERMRQGETSKQRLPGRTGDDCLAFIRAGDGAIVASLVCEAKCTVGHHPGMIAEAHTKVSQELRAPVDLPQLTPIRK